MSRETRASGYMEPNDIESTVYIADPTDEQILAIQTCPGFNEAQGRALKDYYREKACRNCDLKVSVSPHPDREYVYGICPIE